jgi:hypothetical protein
MGNAGHWLLRGGGIFCDRGSKPLRKVRRMRIVPPVPSTSGVLVNVYTVGDGARVLLPGRRRQKVKELSHR